MTTETLPLNLLKANAELQLRLTRLLQESSHQWLDSVKEASSQGIAETSAEIEGVLRSANWQALVSLPTEAFWRQFQGRVAHVQTFQQVAIKNQAAFTSGLQQAIESWHKAVSSALGSDNSASPFADVFKQWNALWSQTTEATQRKAPKGD